MAEDLPFAAEYAKSGRSSCKKCRETIAQDSLRIAVLVQSPHFDGKMPLWNHARCFWAKHKGKVASMVPGDFKGLANLRWEDQENIRARLAGDAGGEDADDADPKPKDFTVDLAKSARSVCRGCEAKIPKGELRVAFKDGRNEAWHHLACFAKTNAAADFPKDTGTVKGFDALSAEDQKTLLQGLKASLKRKSQESNGSSNGSEAKKPKVEDPKKAALKAEADGLWKLRDDLKTLQKKDLAVLLTHNGQEVPSGEAKILDRLADMLFFGALEACGECKSGQLVFSTSGGAYRCTGSLSEWTKCQATVDVPKRRNVKVPKDFVGQDLGWLEECGKRGPRDRTLDKASTASSSVGSSAAAAIAASADRGYAQRSGKSSGAAKSYKSSAKSVKMTVKGGAAIDEACEVADKAHVYRPDGTKDPWAATLNSVDVAAGTNSYYKLQLLQHDKKAGKFYIFRSWGRLGTTIGGDKTEVFRDLPSAKAEFERLYLDKSGNLWEDRHHFVKKPHKMYPVEVDYGESKAATSSVAAGSRSKLPVPVQDLMKLIFDVQAMKETLLEFEIDLEKMPLGKLSKGQISKAYAVLSELQGLAESAEGLPKHKALDASNRFYTLIPHDFGMDKPPLLDTKELLKTKTAMLDALLELEVAYSVLQDSGEAGGAEGQDPLDAQYHQLNCGLRPLDKDSEEFRILTTYVKNTHAATHNMYKLRVEEVFVVERSGEAGRFNPLGLGNRQLLWHGSRTSNYAGILAQGLRIAPPEAPVTGYMFGKGVYFADMVSKSANYCHAPRDGTGLLLLADVALGEPWELTAAHPVTPKALATKGKHSAKGLGRTAPDPARDLTLPHGPKVPLGKPKDTGLTNSSLLYNEYIVYDVDQVNLKYLLKTSFVYS